MLRGTFIFMLIAYCLLRTAPAKAETFSLGIYPPIMQIQTNAPTLITKDFTVVNANDNATNVSIALRLFTSSNTNNGAVQYLPASTKPSPDGNIFKRIQILDNGNPITSLSLAPKQKKDLTIRIALPKDEPGGDYYFSILFQSADDIIGGTNGTHITAGIASNVLLSIAPKDATSGFLDEFSAPVFATTGPIPFTVRVTNTSRHFVAPTGQILVRNMFGQLIGKVDLLSVNVLGNSTRFIPSKDNKEMNGHPIALWNEKVLFGAYRANIILSLSNDGPVFTRVIYFFVMPWQYMVGAFLLVVIVSVVIVRVRKQIKNS